MLTNEQLYGKGVYVPPVPKRHVRRRVILLERNLAIIMKNFPDVDNHILTEIQNAIRFWKKRGENEEGV